MTQSTLRKEREHRNKLLAKRAEHDKMVHDLATERGSIAPAAFRGDKAARTRLDAIHSEIAKADSEALALDEALRWSEQRVKELEAEELAAQERARRQAVAAAAEPSWAVWDSSGLTDPDNVPEIPDQPITRRGDIWLLGDHRVTCGDSTSAADVTPVLAGSQPLLMVTDPPYGVAYDPSWRTRRGCGATPSRRARCSTTIGPTGGRPMRCLPAMSPISGTEPCTATSSPLVWQPAGCSCALRSSGPSSTSP